MNEVQEEEEHCFHTQHQARVELWAGLAAAIMYPPPSSPFLASLPGNISHTSCWKISTVATKGLKVLGTDFWSLVSGFWFLGLGPWFLGLGPWFLDPGSWFMALYS